MRTGDLDLRPFIDGGRHAAAVVRLPLEPRDAGGARVLDANKKPKKAGFALAERWTGR